MLFGTRSEDADTTIFPFNEAGSAGSKLTVPLTPVAVPLMDSSGASVLKNDVVDALGVLEIKRQRRGKDAHAEPRQNREQA